MPQTSPINWNISITITTLTILYMMPSINKKENYKKTTNNMPKLNNMSWKW